MKILVACEESQAVTLELRKRGHEAYSCDIEPCSGGHDEWHIQADVLPLLDGDCKFATCDGAFHEIVGQWDILIAFPPCTYLSNAGNRWLFKDGKLNQDRFQKGIEAKSFFIKILNAKCDRIALENPRHVSCYELPKPSQEIQPYFFGHSVTKATRLWLKGLPVLMATDIVIPERCFLPSSRIGESGLSKRDSKSRSKTFSGIAKAMAAQWT